MGVELTDSLDSETLSEDGSFDVFSVDAAEVVSTAGDAEDVSTGATSSVGAAVVG